ncbi:TPA: HNH endonuclease [Photobacterium damselae]
MSIKETMTKYSSRKAFLESWGFVGDSGNSTWSVCVDHTNRCVFAGIDSRNDNESLIIGNSWKYRKGTVDKPVNKKADGTYPINGNYTKAKMCIDFVENDNYKMRAYFFNKDKRLYSEPFNAILMKHTDGWHAIPIDTRLLNFFDWEDQADCLLGIDYPKGNEVPIKTSQIVDRYGRDVSVAAYVKNCANSQCELCKSTPFLKSSTNKPYLEVHHVKKLADGGSDTVTNAVALCPNCHKEIHFGINASKLIEQLYSQVLRLVRE